MAAQYCRGQSDIIMKIKKKIMNVMIIIRSIQTNKLLIIMTRSVKITTVVIMSNLKLSITIMRRAMKSQLIASNLPLRHSV